MLTLLRFEMTCVYTLSFRLCVLHFDGQVSYAKFIEITEATNAKYTRGCGLRIETPF